MSKSIAAVCYEWVINNPKLRSQFLNSLVGAAPKRRGPKPGSKRGSNRNVNAVGKSVDKALTSKNIE